MDTIEKLRKTFAYNPDSGSLVHLTGKRKGEEAGLFYRGMSSPTVCVPGGRMMTKASLAFTMATGRFPRGHIHALNGDPSDVRIENLREVVPKEPEIPEEDFWKPRKKKRKPVPKPKPPRPKPFHELSLEEMEAEYQRLYPDDDI